MGCVCAIWKSLWGSCLLWVRDHNKRVMDRYLWSGTFLLFVRAVIWSVCEIDPWLLLCPALGNMGRIRSPHMRACLFMEFLLHVFT